MPRDQSGQYTKPPGTTAIPNTTIASAPYNALQDDMADALTESLPRTGVAPMLADLPMNGNKITGLADGADAGDAVNFGQLATPRTKWRLRAIGEIIYVDTSLTGVEIPPVDAGFIELTAGLDGSGQYNEGKLTGEAISGSGATLTATAVIDDSDSPMDGQTISLINTEERVRYAGERAKAGDVFNDQFQGHWHDTQGSSAGGNLDSNTLNRSTSGFDFIGDGNAARNPKSDTVNGTPRTGDRTRAKGQFMVAFLKYKDVA